MNALTERLCRAYTNRMYRALPGQSAIWTDVLDLTWAACDECLGRRLELHSATAFPMDAVAHRQLPGPAGAETALLLCRAHADLWEVRDGLKPATSKGSVA